MASDCSALSLGTLCSDPGFLGYAHGCNKIHDWGIPDLPATCGHCLQQAEYARNLPTLRREFMHMVLLSMFDQAGGYRKDYEYFNAFQQRWQQSDPQQILYAATASKYSPDLQPIKAWCAEAYPALAHVLWKSPTPRPSDESAAVNLPWIPLTSKHLRARRLRPQVFTWIGIMLVHRYRPLMDPLHDDLLKKALADRGPGDEVRMDPVDSDSRAGSEFSTLTAALEADEAAEPVPIDPHAPPAGPPTPVPGRPPTPISTLPPMPSSLSPRLARTIGPMPGEHSVDGPAWHRSLVQNVLQHLGCSAPAFLTAPTTLAEAHSWNALRISISEAGPADYLQGLSIEIQDADSILFRGPSHSRSPMGSATGHVEADMEGAGNGGEGTGESEDCAHDSPESVWEDDAGPENSATRVGPTTTTATLASASDTSDDLPPVPTIAENGDATLEPDDPMAHTATSSEAVATAPSSVLPGDLIYEAGDVSFNLSAASRCLQETRNMVARMRERNRHHRQEDGHNHGDEDATRYDCLACPAMARSVASQAEPSPLHKFQRTDDSHPPDDVSDLEAATIHSPLARFVLFTTFRWVLREKAGDPVPALTKRRFCMLWTILMKQGLRGWFQAWKAWKTFDRQYRAHQKRCKQARRAVLLQAMEEVRKRMQLRGHDGQMLTPDQELRLLTQHFSHRFRATQPADVAMATRTWEGSGDFPLDATVLCHYIQQVPRRKAVPQGHPPSASWRLCADLISPWLCDVLHEQWSTPILQIPRAWTDVDLALVPKPDRSGRDPQDHRPIGLACPLGKKFLGALLQPHVPGIIEKIKLFPQFAYQQGRSQFAALRRVYQHCSSVRAQLQQHTRNLHQRFAGTKAVPLYGALMLTVDLAQAFDRMPRSKLYQGLCRLALPQDLIHILMAWHSSIHYNIHHHQNTSSFRASQGIRQGCSVAPLLWLVFTHEVCCALADKVGRNTLLRILTMFADDFLLADSFTSLAELEHLLNIVAVLFKTLEAFGMQVSAQKSKAILALRGTPSNSVRKRFVRPTQSGEAAFQRLGKVLKGQHHLTAPQMDCRNAGGYCRVKPLQAPGPDDDDDLSLQRGGCIRAGAAELGKFDTGNGDRQYQPLVKAMARLIIRQETSIQILKQNSAWDVYLQPGQQGPLPMLFRASEAYRTEAKSKRMESPLRAQLLHTLFQTVLTCITNLKDNAAQSQAAQARGWLTQEGRWVYQQWDQQTQALIVDNSRQPLDFQELLNLLSAMAQAVRRKDVVHRFNATHQLAADQRGTARFMLEIGLRAEGVADVWKGLEALQGLAALQIVGMQLRRDGLRRSNLAEDVQRMLGEL
ncbi:LINE-1 retrotransposable element ORF2 protein [Symbiodinium microadriaticum]|uniref:LINE-1 retrotransposable element ORF2 protein n=1 Tax=Symbiodinium microadriaticum TaxID=2951 RepID=A0A1Q9CBB9_SYMMI|nr:LINE-1 retrotransposable element ORF2 protein [Symbiodinium microadriaticum]